MTNARRPVSMADLKRVRRKAIALSSVLLRMTPPPIRPLPPREEPPAAQR